MEWKDTTALFKALKRHIPWMLGVLCFFYGTAVYGVSQDGAKSKLAEARENLRVSEATETRISLELERLERSGNVSPEVIKDYETYLDRVHRMVIENRKIVQEMEAALGRYEPREKVTGTSDTLEKGNIPDQKLPEAEVRDEVAALDGEFYASLAAFDEMLLKEMDEIRAKSANKMRDLAHEAAAAAQRVRDKGVEVDTSYQGKTQKTEGEQTDSEKERAEKPEGEQPDSEKEKAKIKGEGHRDDKAAMNRDYERAPGDGKGGTYSRKERPAQYDDDIVARQIREAAEKETDPELKERLWKEYENYKRGKSQ